MTEPEGDWFAQAMQKAELHAQQEQRLTQLAQQDRDTEMRAFAAALFSPTTKQE